MPIIECTLIKGYDNESRKLLSERITDVACTTTGADPELVIVTIKEVDGDKIIALFCKYYLTQLLKFF